jgi:type IV secretion system protein VirD4
MSRKLLSKLPKLSKDKIFNAKGGLVTGYTKHKDKEKIHYISDDLHTLIIGATRSGKTRSIILQTICLLGLSGESMVISDIKGELYDYTADSLRFLGYDVVALDFNEPLKSDRYNFLQPIIDLVAADNVSKAIEYLWDFVKALVPSGKGEPIWENGEVSAIAGCIMLAVLENMDNPQFQNLTNVFYFLSYMGKADDKGIMPLDRYISGLEDTHPAKGLFQAVMNAPFKTRGSFFISAITTLRLFTLPFIYNMTNASDFEPVKTCKKKTAIFIILPYERTTYHSLASLFCYSLYLELAIEANKRGGRIPVRVNYVLDEFGNFTKIPAFDNELSVGGGAGIRFNIVVQSFEQIEKVYGKEVAEIIKNNCHCLIYLMSNALKTVEEISRRLDKYTTSAYSRSSSSSSYGGGNSTSSMNLIARSLLTPSEVQSIKRPDVLVMLINHPPAMMKLPDISKQGFNTALGLGDMTHNQALRMIRGSNRPIRGDKKMELWGVWNYYNKSPINIPMTHEYMPDKPMTAYERDNMAGEGGYIFDEGVYCEDYTEADNGREKHVY